MKFYTRKLIKPGDLNPNNTLFGGALLRWIDEEASLHAMSLMSSKHVVTKYISEIDFISSAKQGDIVEIGLEFLKVGTTSLTLRCEVRSLWDKKAILTIDKLVFVRVNEEERPVAHGLSYNDIAVS